MVEKIEGGPTKEDLQYNMHYEKKRNEKREEIDEITDDMKARSDEHYRKYEELMNKNQNLTGKLA